MYPCQGLTRAFLGRINPELDQTGSSRLGVEVAGGPGGEGLVALG